MLFKTEEVLFNSLAFLIFFPIVTGLFYLLPHSWRWLLLLGASIYFYMYFVPIYILILFGTIIIDYTAGILIGKSEGFRRKFYLLASLISNLGILFVFKYFNFFMDEAGILSKYHLDILLPVGLSFHTFQAMSYTIEVYKGNQASEKHFGIYALYVMFYPQLVAGPIERPQNILWQFRKKMNFSPQLMSSGLRLMLWGFFKKIVIADRLSIYVDQVYDHPSEYGMIPILVSSIFFAFQIYCDFSGYSDIAIGAARCMGFELMENFRMPYFSKSVSEFWTRWHISLSTWFRDYVYIPLGGNRVGHSKWIFNILLTFFLSGFWHGANWTFIIWGVLNGLYLLIEKQFQKINFKVPAYFSGLTTFTLILISWVCFRANNLGELKTLLVSFLTRDNRIFITADKKDVILGIASITGLLMLEIFLSRKRLDQWIISRPLFIRWTVYTSFLWTIIVFGVYAERQFIYFVF